MVEEIQKSSKLRVSNYAGDSDFLEARFNRIRKHASDLGLSVVEDRAKAFQHIVTFIDGKSHSATFQLWYNAKGYSGKDILVSTASDELSSVCIPLIESSYSPEIVPFSAPNRPFAEKLVAFVRSQIEEVGIQLLDITQENYQDIFHLKTDGFAQIGLTYTAKGNYTHMRLTSSLGALDTKLQTLRKRFM